MRGNHHVIRAGVVLCLQKFLQFGSGSSWENCPDQASRGNWPTSAIAWVKELCCPEAEGSGYSYELVDIQVC